MRASATFKGKTYCIEFDDSLYEDLILLLEPTGTRLTAEIPNDCIRIDLGEFISMLFPKRRGDYVLELIANPIMDDRIFMGYPFGWVPLDSFGHWEDLVESASETDNEYECNKPLGSNWIKYVAESIRGTRTSDICLVDYDDTAYYLAEYADGIKYIITLIHGPKLFCSSPISKYLRER